MILLTNTKVTYNNKDHIVKQIKREHDCWYIILCNTEGNDEKIVSNLQVQEYVDQKILQLDGNLNDDLVKLRKYCDAPTQYLTKIEEVHEDIGESPSEDTGFKTSTFNGKKYENGVALQASLN